MTRLTITQARDLMYQAAVAALPNGFNVAWPDQPFTIPVDTPWARVTIKLAGRSQRAMGANSKKYIAFGTFCIQLFTLKGDGQTASDSLADSTVVNLESATSSLITYRNIRAVDIGPDGAFTHTQVLADFEYEDHH